MLLRDLSTIGIFVLLPLALIALQWMANRYKGRVALSLLTLVLIGIPLWIAHVEIPRAVEAQITSKTCFNCGHAYFMQPVLWGFSALFAVAAIVIATRRPNKAASSRRLG
jgi:hypothetical protein